MRSVSHHIILWIVALSILNTSIDVMETFIPINIGQQEHNGDREQYDEIESIVELVMDETSDHTQTLPDNKESDQQSLLKKAVSFDFSLPVKKEKLLSPIIINLNSRPEVVNEDALLPAGFTTLFSPPPDFA